MSTVQLAGNGFGGLLQGNFGTYTQASDGTYTVDNRDAAVALSLGMTYLRNGGETYTLPAAPRAASVGRIAASAAMSNGPIAIANQPDVPRGINVIVGAGSIVPSAGNVAITYTGTDQQLHTDSFAATLAPVNGSATVALSRGSARLSTIVVAGMSGGVLPWVRLDDTNLLALPSDPNATDFTVAAEYDAGVLENPPGTPSTTPIGCTSVQTTPNGTVTYSFLYGFVAPTS